MSLSILANTEQFVRFLLGKLLDKRLIYHNLTHTANVVKYATSLAAAEGLSPADTELVLIAEWFHDTGFTVAYSDNEEKSAQIAAGFLEPLLSASQIKIITDCILATKKGTIPTNKMQYVVHDADYYHFFQPEYFQLVDNLKKEMSELLEKEISHKEWYNHNAKFLSEHVFYTKSCKAQWEKQREILIAENNRILHQ